MTTIDRDQLQQMLDSGATTLVEVLDEKYFNKFHLPEAINVPLSGRFEGKIVRAVPDKREPVVVYCMNEDCDASPRAARIMEDMGYNRVYDYEAGKMDWKGAGHPIEI